MKAVLKQSLIWLLALTILIGGCKKEESECETFQNTKAEIQFWQISRRGYSTTYVQTLTDSVTAGTILFKLNKQYDKVRWLINNDSNYIYNSSEVSLGFSAGKRYSILAIGERFINSKECKNIQSCPKQI